MLKADCNHSLGRIKKAIKIALSEIVAGDEFLPNHHIILKAMDDPEETSNVAF